MSGQPEFQKQLQSIESLLGRIENSADPELQSTVRALVRLIMDLHGEGLSRMLELLGADDEGAAIIARLSRDELVGSLLILYELHPKPLEERVHQALDKARSSLRHREGELELIGIENGTVRLRLSPHGHGCGSTAQALKEIVEDAIYQAAPDVAALIVDVAEDKESAKQGFVPIEMLLGGSPAPGHSTGHLVAVGEKG